MTSEPGTVGYFAADAEAGDELERLKLIEAAFDAHTFRHLDTIGVEIGWRCLEVGAGAGSVVRGLSERVGATGKVVAADIDPRFIGDLQQANIEVRRCDITCDDVEPAHYELVHSRLLLMHLADPTRVLERMAAALRPGGWLVCEECDGAVIRAIDAAHPRAGFFDTTFWKVWDFIATAGMMNPYLGPFLPSHIQCLGFIETGNEAVSWVAYGGDSWSRWWTQTLQRVNAIVIANGVISESEMAALCDTFKDPTFAYRGYGLLSAWGRTPPRV
jgi:SAM-dependent methyltransferase